MNSLRDKTKAELLSELTELRQEVAWLKANLEAKSDENSRVALAETRLLYDISARLNTAQSQEEVLEAAILPGIMAGASSAGIWLFDATPTGQPDWMEFTATWVREGKPLMPLGTRLRLVDFPSYKILLSDPGQPSFMGDIGTDERVDPHLRATFSQVGVRAVALVPLTIGDRWIGLTVISWQTPHTFSAGEQQLYQSIAAQTAITLENRRLFAQTQAALANARQSQEDLLKFKLGIEQSNEAIFLTDINGTILYVNPAFEKIYGFTREEALGCTPRILKSGLIPQEAYEHFWKTLLAKGTVAGEIVNKAKDGRFINVAGNNNPILDEQGNIIGFLAVHHDITERKQAEEALARRVTEFQTVSQVSAAVATIVDTDRLLQLVVDLTKSSFNLYHAHIYLYDEIEGSLNLAAGAGEVGGIMVAQGWRIPFDKEQSLVAQAARTGEGVIVNDVRQNPDFLPNPLLPETRSEMAIPIMIGGLVLGVLDVQSDQLNHFTADDVRIQTVLAEQIAVALENARSFAEQERANLMIQKRVRELNCLNEIGREIAETPAIPEFLQWITERIPLAMQYPKLCLAAIEYDDRVYGVPQAINAPCQIVHGLRVSGQVVGRVYIAYSKKQEFLDEESALIGGIANRVSGYIESRRLFEQTLDALAQIEQSQHLLRTLLDNIPNPIFYKDTNGAYLGFNRAFLEYIGKTEEELLGKTVYDLNTDKTLADRYHQADLALLRNPGAQTYEAAVKYADGTVRDVIFNKATFTNPDGALGGLVGAMVDITERKRAEETLRENEGRLSEALAIARLGYWEMDITNQMFTFTDQLYALLHTTAEQEGGYQMPAMQYAQKFVHPDDAYILSPENQQILEMAEPGQSRQLEHRIIRADGSEGYIVVRFREIKDEQGQTVKTVGVNQDITEQKQIEEALRQSEIRYRTMTENLPIGLYRNTPGPVGKFITANKAMAEIFGYDSLEEFLQIRVADLYPDPAQRKALSDKLLAQGQVIGEEMEFKRKDGTRLWAAMTATVVRDETGEVKYFDGIIEDITERKLAEEALRENEARLAEALAIARLAYWEFDVATQTFTWSDQAYALLHTTAEQEGGYQMTAMKYAQKFIHPDDAYILNPENQRDVLKVTELRQSRRLEHRIIRADGSEGYFLVRFREIKDEQGRTIRTVGINQDITEQKQAEAERERLLTEVQGAYRQYVQREWGEFLGEQQQGSLHIEHQQKIAPAVSNEELAKAQAEVTREGKAKVIAPHNGDPTQPAIVAPIALRGQVIGTLSLQDIDPDRYWTDEEKALVETVSEQLALTVENLRLFDDTQKRAIREHMTRQIADKMRAAPDIDSIVRTGLNELAKALNVSRAYVKLTTQPEDKDQ